MTPNSDRTSILFLTFLPSRRFAAPGGFLLTLLLLLLAFPAGQAAADGPNYLKRDTLVASNYETESGAHLGEAVAVSGDTVVVGAPNENNARGAVYVYVRPTGEWTISTISETAKLTVSGLGNGSEFGASVAISGDTIVVGAPGEEADKGAAYVFVRPASGDWQNVTAADARLTETEPARQPDDRFGASVAVSGDTVAIGAPATDDTTHPGMAYVFSRPGSGWTDATPNAILSDTNVAVGDSFGQSVATHGNTVVVGAPLDDFGANGTTQVDRGSAYIYLKPGSGWVNATEADFFLASENGQAGDHFGVSVAIREDGKVVVVGAEYATPAVVTLDAAAAANQGLAYVFIRPDEGWVADPTEDAILSIAAGSSSDQFGHAVGISGDTIVVGAPGKDAVMGAAYVFVQPNVGPQDPSPITPMPLWATTDTSDAALSAGADGAASEQFGESVAVSGGTIAAGVPFDTIPATETPINQGSAYLFVNAFCSAVAAGNWHAVESWVGDSIPSSTDDVCISTGHKITMDAPAINVAAVTETAAEIRRLLVNPGATLDLLSFDIAVDEEVINNGTLMQTKQQNTLGPIFQDAEILRIVPSSGAPTLYWGVNVDSAANLGNISVTLRETIDWYSPTAQYQFCTADGVTSPAYAQRCYTITVDSSAEATVTLWGQADELSGVAVSDLAVYRYDGSSWVKIDCANPGFCSSFPGAFIGYAWAKGETPGFSEFLLGDANEGMAPTAVNLLGIEVAQAWDVTAVLLVSMAFLALAALGLLLQARKKRAMN